MTIRKTCNSLMRRRIHAICALGMICLALSTFVEAQTGGPPPVYFTYSTINFPGSLPTVVRGRNDMGEMVGAYDSASGLHAFLYSGGTFTTIPDVPGGHSIVADAINNVGQIIGDYWDSSNVNHGFLISGGNFTLIDFPGAAQTIPFGINDAGWIVGTYYETFGGVTHGFMVSAANLGDFTVIDFPGAPQSSLVGINNNGDIVGRTAEIVYVCDEDLHCDFSYRIDRGFLLSGGNFTLIDVPGAGFTTMPTAINDAGWIVGVYGNGHSFLRSGGTSFGTIDIPGQAQTSALGINNIGEIVGGTSGQFGFVMTLPATVTTPASMDMESVSVALRGGTAVAGGVQVTYSSVTAPGDTTATTSSTGPTLPAGFQLGQPATYYDITTTARFNPPVEVCINYTGISFSLTPMLLHYENGSWVDRTTSVDTANKTICGIVNSLSPFVIVQSPAKASRELCAQVNGYNIPSGIRNSLCASLNAAAASFDRGNMAAGVNQLRAFQNKVRAQSGKAISSATANALIAAAQRIIRAVTG